MKRSLLLLALLLAVATVVVIGLRSVVPHGRVGSSSPTVPAIPATSTSVSPPPASPSSQPAASSSVATPAATPADPFALISPDSLFAFLEDLTGIQPYSGWRNSATEGEAEALDYVATRLAELPYLRDIGLEIERQSFRVFLATELWETRLELTLEGKKVEVPADGQRGPRDDISRALRFDSDGALNDSERDPVVVAGRTVLIRSAGDLERLAAGGLKGMVVVLDYAAVDRVTSGGAQQAAEVAAALLAGEPAGVVLVTQFSNQAGKSHGSFVGDGNPFDRVGPGATPPVLYARLEDLAPAGIKSWDDLERVEEARLTWDADVLSPATSGNLVAHIPGADPMRAVVLGAHIDSPNGPGALDDGSGSAILLEMARVLDAARLQPPTDLYLAWYGSEELGLYGSAHFVSTHQELLDRTVAMLQIDCLSLPLEGIAADLTLVSRSYGWLGDARLPWSDYLVGAVERQGIRVLSADLPVAYSDNSNYAAYDVPNADLIFVNEPAMEATGSLHYAAHIHDPYDTVGLAREVGDVFQQMAAVVLAAALEPPDGLSAVRVTPRAERRALFVASHTEPVHMTPATFTELGMALAWEGYDVDLVPYGQALTTADLEGADLVIVLPVVDYPSRDGGAAPYDEAWAEEEIAALEAYVAGGGHLLLANSAHRLKYGGQVLELNEDWSEANALAERFGLRYREGSLSAGEAQAVGSHPLVAGVETLRLLAGNALPLDWPAAGGWEVLAQADGAPAVVWAERGQGWVLALADVGLLLPGEESGNVRFWRNVAGYGRR